MVNDVTFSSGLVRVLGVQIWVVFWSHMENGWLEMIGTTPNTRVNGLIGVPRSVVKSGRLDQTLKI